MSAEEPSKGELEPAPEPAPSPVVRPQSKSKAGRVLIVGLVALTVLVFGAIVWLRVSYQSFKVPSGAMTPTIVVDDHLFMRRGSADGIARGEIVVFPFPENPEADFIKRVVGLGGDVVDVVDGRPVLGGWPVPECKVGPYPTADGTPTLYLEFIGAHAYGVLRERDTSGAACSGPSDCADDEMCLVGLCGHERQGPYPVPEGHLFVLGDTRHASHDARSWFGGRGGTVEARTVRARGGVVWFNPGASHRFGASIDGVPVLGPELAALAEAIERCLAGRPSAEDATPPER